MKNDYSSVFKVWGIRKRILLNNTSEIDLITVNKDCYCSTHWHDWKINKFVCLEGKIKIESEYGEVILRPGEEFEIRPPMVHRFFGIENSRVIELAYVDTGRIDDEDIHRIVQGGKVIKGKEISLVDLQKDSLLGFNQGK